MPPIPWWSISPLTRLETVDRYFAVPPSPRDRLFGWFVIALGGGTLAFTAVLFVQHDQRGWPLLVLGVFALACGIVLVAHYHWWLNAALPKVPDQEMDDRLELDLDAIGNRAMAMLGISPIQLDMTAAQVLRAKPPDAPRWLANNNPDLPAIVFGPVVEVNRQRCGLDDVWRFRSYEVLVLMPTEHRLGVYQCVLDMRSGKASRQRLAEYFYTDVVAVNLVDSSAQLSMRGIAYDKSIAITHWQKATLREMELVVASSDASAIRAGLSWLRSGRPFTVQESGLEYVVVALRNLLKKKRKQPVQYI